MDLLWLTAFANGRKGLLPPGFGKTGDENENGKEHDDTVKNHKCWILQLPSR